MGGLFEGNQFLFIVLLALVISGALRVALELRNSDQALRSSPSEPVPAQPCIDTPKAASASTDNPEKEDTLQATAAAIAAVTAASNAQLTSDKGLTIQQAVQQPSVTGPLQGLSPWTLPSSISQDIFPVNSTIDPSKFKLHVKVLAFDRADSILRVLESLEKADYSTDTVSLDIFVDHPHSGDPAKWTPVVSRRVSSQHNLLLRLDGFKWSHGEKRVIYRTQNQGIQPQWLEAWWPDSINDFALIVEDDMEVSPVYYQYFKRLVAHYYYNASNFEPRMFGVSFQRQTFVAGIGGTSFKPHPHPYLYQLVGTWGQFLFPLPWRSFRFWYDQRRHNQSREPVLQGLKTTQWWFNKGNRLWTPWIIKWAYSESMFTLYPAFPSNVSLSISHRDKGSNFAKNRGADSSLIPSIPDNPKDPVKRWWDTEFPPLNKALRRDLCFHVLPHYPPARSVDELNYFLEALKLEVKRVALVIVPRGGYDVIRNWLCHLAGTKVHNFVIVLSCPYQASVLSNMGHMVYLTSSGSNTTSQDPTVKMVDRSLGLNQWTAEHVHLMLAGLTFGFDILLCSPYNIWVGDPLANDLGESYDMWGHLDLINFSDSYLYVHSTETTIAAWSRLRTAWLKAETSGKSSVLLQQAAHGWLMGRDTTFHTVEGVPCDAAAAKGSGDRPFKLVALPPRGSKQEKIEVLQEAGLWVVDDFDYACKAISCRKKLPT